VCEQIYRGTGCPGGAVYWADVLQKDTIMAYQASKRGGMLYCTPQDDERISICGKAVLIAISEIFASLV
jgi:hypothetical protein